MNTCRKRIISISRRNMMMGRRKVRGDGERGRKGRSIVRRRGLSGELRER